MNKLALVWQLLRQLSGDDAYDRYLAHAQQSHPERPCLNRKEFFKDVQERKWQGVTRCC